MTCPTNVFTYEASMTVSGTEYKLDKATWADRSAWVNYVTWPYADNADNPVTTARLEKTWDKFWHQALTAVFPMEEGTNMRAVTAFRINGNIAGFFMNYYNKTDKHEKISSIATQDYLSVLSTPSPTADF